jgi:hypothetical protein
MTWRWLGGEEDPDESRVEIDLRPVPGGTELTFTHSALFSEETRRSHEEGWSGALWDRPGHGRTALDICLTYASAKYRDP